MGKWVFLGEEKGLKRYRCSACGFTKSIMSRHQYFKTKCPICKKINKYKYSEVEKNA